MTEQPLKLNIGGGTTELEGFVCVDRRNGDEAYPLPYDDGAVDEIRASHVLEHFDREESIKVLQEWSRVLKVGGCMKIAVPDFGFIADQYVHANGNRRDIVPTLFAYTMGGQTNDDDYHKSVWDKNKLDSLMQMVGLCDIGPWESEIEDCAKLQVSLNLQGIKRDLSVVVREANGAIKLPKITAIMSTSRLGFTENLFCAMSVFAPRGIELVKHTGAFWGQCLERVIVDCITREKETDRPEWILTLDYDTVFNTRIFDRLCFEMAMHPNADAIAPWQCKREEDLPLCWFVDGGGNKRSEIPMEEFDKDTVRVRDAHFGLTLLRVSALEKMKHPWFWEQPNDDGEWSDGRLDPDIYFWRKWQDAGNTLYLANRTGIGHLQQMVTWIHGVTRKPIHQYLTDYQKHGPPEEAIR